MRGQSRKREWFHAVQEFGGLPEACWVPAPRRAVRPRTRGAVLSATGPSAGGPRAGGALVGRRVLKPVPTGT